MIEIRRWKKPRFFSKQFLTALCLASIFHFLGAVLFRIAPIQFGSGKKTHPPVVTFATLPSPSTIAEIKDGGPNMPAPKFRELSLPPFPLDFSVNISGPIKEAEGDDSSFQSVEDQILADSVSSPEIPLLLAPVEIKISGQLAEQGLKEKNILGVLGAKQPFLPSQTSRTQERHSVLVDMQTGRVIWHDPIGTAGSSIAENILKQLEFEKTENFSQIKGEIEFILTLKEKK